MVHAHLRQAVLEDGEPTALDDSPRRDGHWGGHAWSHEADLAWAARRAAVTMAAATLRARDGGTGAHSDDVVHLCDAIAEELGVHGHERAELLAAAQLHDIGKVGIPQELLGKRGPLDDQEWDLIRDHTVAGERIVESVPELDEVARLVRHSHERWDGAGYPDGLSGEDIPLGSRIVFCADAFHAIRSDRPYRRGRSARAALDEVRRGAGTQFDPEVADALVKAAGDLRRTVHAGAPGLTTTLRSRRLLSLLLTLAIGGSALAAGGSYVARDDGDRPAGHVAPAATPTSDAAGRDDTPERKPREAAAKARRRGQGGTARAETSRAEDSTANGSSQATRRRAADTPAAGTVERSRHSRAASRRRRVGRLASPGRSGEAPGRPAQPGRPVGGAPGRSEEAPRRPSWAISPPAKAVPLPTGPASSLVPSRPASGKGR